MLVLCLVFKFPKYKRTTNNIHLINKRLLINSVLYIYNSAIAISVIIFVYYIDRITIVDGVWLALFIDITLVLNIIKV